MSCQTQNFDLSKFIKGDKIGEGAFSTVFKVEEKETGQIYAAKCLSSPLDSDSKEMMLRLSREVNISASINHPSVLKFIG